AIDSYRAPRKHRVEQLRLGQRTREPIENEPGGGVSSLESVLDELDHRLIAHQVAAREDVRDFTPERGFFAHRGAQQITARHLGNVRQRTKHTRLCAFSSAWRA